MKWYRRTADCDRSCSGLSQSAEVLPQLYLTRTASSDVMVQSTADTCRCGGRQTHHLEPPNGPSQSLPLFPAYRIWMVGQLRIQAARERGIAGT